MPGTTDDLDVDGPPHLDAKSRHVTGRQSPRGRAARHDRPKSRHAGASLVNDAAYRGERSQACRPVQRPRPWGTAAHRRGRPVGRAPPSAPKALRACCRCSLSARRVRMMRGPNRTREGACGLATKPTRTPMKCSRELGVDGVALASRFHPAQTLRWLPALRHRGS